jgi:hypothetical protein
VRLRRGSRTSRGEEDESEKQTVPPRQSRGSIDHGKRLTPSPRGIKVFLRRREVSLGEDSRRLLGENVELEGQQQLLQVRPGMEFDREGLLLADRVVLLVLDSQAHLDLVSAGELLAGHL